MPPKSEAQRRAMYAAAAGKSTLGIPRSVGEEFVAADQGGTLPKRTKSRKRRPLTKPGHYPGVRHRQQQLTDAQLEEQRQRKRKKSFLERLGHATIVPDMPTIRAENKRMAAQKALNRVRDAAGRYR